jgi:hypothetical protein
MVLPQERPVGGHRSGRAAKRCQQPGLRGFIADAWPAPFRGGRDTSLRFRSADRHAHTARLSGPFHAAVPATKSASAG